MSMEEMKTAAAEDAAPPPVSAPWSTGRLAGILALGFWVVAGLGLVYFLWSVWDPDKIARYGPKLLSGLWVTVSLVAASIILGALISLPVAFGRMSKNRFIGALAYGYVYIFRGTPLIMQVFLIYYGLGSFRPQLDAICTWWFFREAYNCALLAFTLNTAAYQAEILRGAIQSVPRGQWEASRALGLHPLPAFFRVILPQALMVALRPYGNEIILMIKGSAIVSIVTVFDLMGETRRAYSRTFDFQMYLWAAVLYLAIVELLRNVWNALERRLTRHLRR